MVGWNCQNGTAESERSARSGMSKTSMTGLLQSQVVCPFSEIADWVGVGRASPSWLRACVRSERLGGELGFGIGDAVVGCWFALGSNRDRGLGPFPEGSTDLDALAG